MSRGRGLTITIDGPSGAGKTTSARRLASRLDYLYLESGALYRAMAMRVRAEGLDLTLEEEVARLCRRTAIGFSRQGASLRIVVGGEDVTEALRTPALATIASQVSAYACVRDLLVPIQRQIGQEGGVVAEGRDMGTVVFPGAEIKFFLDGTLEARAARRWRELVAQGFSVDLETTLKETRDRDERDRERQLSPLRRAEHAIVIDTTDLTLDEVGRRMFAECSAVRGG